MERVQDDAPVHDTTTAIPASLQLLRKSEVAKLLSVNPFTVDRFRRNGNFPSPIWISDTTPCWRAADIARWIAERQSLNAPTHSKTKVRR
jgi:predicted DNA-binding transcriptional regulator AlpA